ncbi:hypothetical protein N9B73_01510 [Verrucomicrobiales bacterium]|nr:hypothetical protein [Verrucomicrobiales bacterium]
MNLSRRQISRTAGLTLVEVTLVVAVLLTLVSILFIGATSYKEGTNRAKCLLTISTIQKAVRSYQNLYELEPGDAITYEALVGADKLVEYITPCGSQNLSPIAAGSSGAFATSGYTTLGEIPGSGIPLLSCQTTGLQHLPAGIGGW